MNYSCKTDDKKKKEILDKAKKRGKGPASDFGETPEEKEMLKLISSKPSVKTEKDKRYNCHNNGSFNYSCDTDDKKKTVKEQLFSYLTTNSLNEEKAKKAKEIKELIISKTASKKLKPKCGKDKRCDEAFRKISVAESNYAKEVPGSFVEYKRLLEEYKDLF